MKVKLTCLTRLISLTVRRLAFSGICILTLFSCATPESTSRSERAVKNARIQRELREERQLGRGIAEGLIQDVGLDESVTEPARIYYKSLGLAIAREFGRPGSHHSFEILNSDQPNAYATPGGYIFVTRGLLEKIRSLDELVEVICHELAHVNEQHVYQIVRPKTESPSGLFILARLLSGGAGDLGAAMSQAVQKGVDVLLKSGLDPSLEKAADEIGVSYAATLGFDPKALAELVLRLDSQESPSDSSPTPQSDSHLHGKSRANWIQTRIHALDLTNVYQDSTAKFSRSAKKRRIDSFQEFQKQIRSKTDLSPLTANKSKP